jgi:hypothetical protein
LVELAKASANSSTAVRLSGELGFFSLLSLQVLANLLIIVANDDRRYVVRFKLFYDMIHVHVRRDDRHKTPLALYQF